MTRRVSEQSSCDHPRVSVHMITYNHERFIVQAIESVLNQAVDFEVELVIGEDCSTDSTRRMVQDYAHKYPGVIRALLPDKNLGAQKNCVNVFAGCRGDFIACLEGDDYWTDNQKLARQAKFLDGHPECVSCFHNVLIVSGDPSVSLEGSHVQTDGRHLMCAPHLKARFSQEDFFKHNVIPTCSVMFRREAIGNLPPWFEKLAIGDLPLHILCTEHGTAAYLPEVMGVYRLHGQSNWSSKTPIYRVSRTLDMYEVLERHFQGRPQAAALWEVRMDMLQGYARLLRRAGQSSEASAAAVTYIHLALKDPLFCLKHLSRLRRMCVLFCCVKLGRSTKL